MDEDLNPIFAWRYSSRISQKLLAEALGVRQTTISRWERGKRSPPLHKIAALARYSNGGLTVERLAAWYERQATRGQRLEKDEAPLP